MHSNSHYARDKLIFETDGSCSSRNDFSIICTATRQFLSKLIGIKMRILKNNKKTNMDPSLYWMDKIPSFPGGKSLNCAV